MQMSFGTASTPRRAYLKFATAPEAQWRGNFRELSASITRMATVADRPRITERLVYNEIVRLKANWIEVHDDDLSDLLSADQITQKDTFDRLQLQSVIEVCRRRRSILRRPGGSCVLHSLGNASQRRDSPSPSGP